MRVLKGVKWELYGIGLFLPWDWEWEKYQKWEWDEYFVTIRRDITYFLELRKLKKVCKHLVRANFLHV